MVKDSACSISEEVKGPTRPEQLRGAEGSARPFKHLTQFDGTVNGIPRDEAARGAAEGVSLKGRAGLGFTAEKEGIPTLDGDQKPKGPLRRMGARQRPSTAWGSSCLSTHEP